MRRSGINTPILLIGAGRMGGAMLRGWLKAGLGPVIAVEPNTPAIRGVRFVPGIADIPTGPIRACVIALKPQILKIEAASLSAIAAQGAPVISIAAGSSIASLRKHWGRNAKILRAMPNTPGAIGKGISALYAPATISADDRALAEQLLAPLGQTFWVRQEKMIDVVTAVSGSGPAYVFLMVEALAEAAQAEGFSRETAEQLARATLTGAGALLEADSRPAAALRRDVTSPGGTTEAALKVLMADKGLAQLMAKAVHAARKRAGELSS